MKTKPERQYDIFFVTTEEGPAPKGAAFLTAYDPVKGGRWAIQYGSLVSQFEGLNPQMGSMSSPSWDHVL